jgi:hypothetical protein
VNLITLSELPEGAPIMTGTFSINHQPVIILFDSGATHSFISSKCGIKIGLNLYPTSEAYMCYHHNLAGPKDGPRATWAEENHRNGLRIGVFTNMSRARMAVYLRIV